MQVIHRGWGRDKKSLLCPARSWFQPALLIGHYEKLCLLPLMKVATETRAFFKLVD